MAEVYYLELDSLLFGNGNSKKLQRRFKKLLFVRSGNEVVVKVNVICVTTCAINGFCLFLM